MVMKKEKKGKKVIGQNGTVFKTANALGLAFQMLTMIVE